MHITKISPKFQYTLIMSGLLALSPMSYAQDEHDHSNHQQHTAPTMTHHHQAQNHSAESHADHLSEHGGQIYQATTLESAWTVDDDGKGSASTKLKTWVGTDENKLFIKAHVEKAEAHQAETEAKLLYSRNISDFWDVQAGVRYQYQPEQPFEKDQWSAVFGLHGLAPYFFETDAYLYVGEDQRWQLSLDTSRDLLLTQKWIAQPYLNLDIVLNDDSKYARSSGLAKAQTGLQLRYEITKQVMPFVDVAYTYQKGRKQTAWQVASSDEQGGLYGAGITFKF